MGGSRVKRAAGAGSPTPELVRLSLPCEVRVVDEERREIEVCATSEAVDGHGTVFSYDASKDAFARWAGNVREMHDRKAVGRKVDVRCDDDARRVYVRLRISAGAQDTWEKVKDGTLAGASIGASNVVWGQQRRAGREVPVATRYDLVELSLVDVGSNPDSNGYTFVRDGVPDGALLDDVETAAPPVMPAAIAPATPTATTPPVIREGAGALSVEDPAALIAAAALARGLASMAESAAESQRRGDEPAAGQGSRRMSREQRIGAVAAAVGGVASIPSAPQAAAQAGQVARAEIAGDDDGDGDGPGAPYDGDGDHDGAVPADQRMAHAADVHSHEAHDHTHTGAYYGDDQHEHDGAHLHEDGTSHAHAHAHDHSAHHDHAALGVQRAVDRAAGSAAGEHAGHAHPHVHSHHHAHYFRVADGAALDERLVSAEQARTREYVSETAFRAAGGVDGRGLTVAQYRVAAGVETRLELEAAERAQGAFSRNPLGAADIGTPAAAQPLSTDALIASGGVSAGQVTPMDRDGQQAASQPAPGVAPSVASAPDGSDQPEPPVGGSSDASQPADGYADLLEGRRALVADVTASVSSSVSASVTAAVASAVGGEMRRALDALADLSARVAVMEAQPMPVTGPVLRAAERGTALTPTMLGGASGSASLEQRMAALESMAGKISDPQAQVAVAAELVRLQQEAAGYGPAFQVMPRAGSSPR